MRYLEIVLTSCWAAKPVPIQPNLFPQAMLSVHPLALRARLVLDSSFRLPPLPAVRPVDGEGRTRTSDLRRSPVKDTLGTLPLQLERTSQQATAAGMTMALLY